MLQRRKWLRKEPRSPTGVTQDSFPSSQVFRERTRSAATFGWLGPTPIQPIVSSSIVSLNLSDVITLGAKYSKK